MSKFKKGDRVRLTAQALRSFPYKAQIGTVACNRRSTHLVPIRFDGLKSIERIPHELVVKVGAAEATPVNRDLIVACILDWLDGDEFSAAVLADHLEECGEGKRAERLRKIMVGSGRVGSATER